MNVVLPMVAMVFFSVLCVGAFAWMRRPEFGESEKSAVRVALSPTKAPSPLREVERNVGLPLRTERTSLASSNVEVKTPKGGCS